MPLQSNIGGVGAFVTSAKKGKGTVSAKYKLNSVILIKGEMGKIKVLVDTVTIQSECFAYILT
jgi:hypothetical protein